MVVERNLPYFLLRTTDDSVRTGQSAELKCNVISPTDTLIFAWYNSTEIIQGMLVVIIEMWSLSRWIKWQTFNLMSCNLLTGTRKESTQDSTTTTTLNVDYLTEDEYYTCKVQGHQEYTFISIIEVNGNLYGCEVISIKIFCQACNRSKFISSETNLIYFIDEISNDIDQN